MADPTPPQPQMSLREVLSMVSRSGFRLSVAATIVLILGIMAPFVGVRLDIGFGATNATLTGIEAAGWLAWLTVLIFAGACAAHKVEALRPYRNLLELGAMGATSCLLLWAWFFNPAAEQLGQAGKLMEAFAPAGEAAPKFATQYPHLGMVLAVVAAVIMMMARRRDRLDTGA